MGNALERRIVTIASLFVFFVLLTVLLPLLALVAVGIDVIGAVIRGKAWVVSRTLVFAWVYVVGEIWAVVSLATVGLLPRHRGLASTYRLQKLWARWNLTALRALFGLSFSVESDDVVSPGPIVLLARHSSLIDSLLPAVFVTGRHGMRLRYVLKKELLVDPALDIAGNRLPNVFVDRDSADSARERGAISDLVHDLGSDEGVLIFPEGTRYTEAKRVKYVAALGAEPGRIGELAKRLRGVLPPRPGGTLALLESTSADVVVLAHRGLEGFATVRDVLSGDLVGRTVTVRFWRIPRKSIPSSRSDRVEWLFQLWATLDAWVVDDVPPEMSR
jgi:1-acyl-sn-glycerol-3-phosphate acyltransferase